MIPGIIDSKKSLVLGDWAYTFKTYTPNNSTNGNTGYGSNTLGCYVSNNGEYLITTGNISTTTTVCSYTLSTPFDISTAVYTSTGPVITSGVITKTSTDGSIMYSLQGGTLDRLLATSLSTPWDVTTYSFLSVSSSFTEDTGYTDFEFSYNGDKLFLIGTNNTIYQYSLSIPWDITTISYDSVFLTLTPSGTYGIKDFTLSQDGLTIFTVDYQSLTRRVYEYQLSTPWDLSTINLTPQTTINFIGFSTANNGPFRIQISEDRRIIYGGCYHNSFSYYTLFQYSREYI